MKYILFWHVVSHSEENDKQVQMSLVSTPPDTKVSLPHFLNVPSTLLYKKKQYRLKKKLNNRAPSNWETEITGTENVVASLIKMLQYADKPHPAVILQEPRPWCKQKNSGTET